MFHPLAHRLSLLKGKKKEKWRKNRGAKINPTKITFPPKIAWMGLALLIMMNSPIFQVAKERTKHAKSRWAIFLGLLERTIRQRVRFIVKASAAGSAKRFINPPSPLTPPSLPWEREGRGDLEKDDKQNSLKGQPFDSPKKAPRSPPVFYQ
jgi:hypothetical protein